MELIMKCKALLKAHHGVPHEPMGESTFDPNFLSRPHFLDLGFVFPDVLHGPHEKAAQLVPLDGRKRGKPVVELAPNSRKVTGVAEMLPETVLEILHVLFREYGWKFGVFGHVQLHPNSIFYSGPFSYKTARPEFQ